MTRPTLTARDMTDTPGSLHSDPLALRSRMARAWLRDRADRDSAPCDTLYSPTPIGGYADRVARATGRLKILRTTFPAWATAGGVCLVDRQSPGGPDYCGACDGAESPYHCRTHGPWLAILDDVA
jgi:hypothetical protein